jgi:hypothetical protein
LHLGRFGHHVQPKDLDGAVVRQEQGGDQPDKGGLARAVAAQHAVYLAALHLQRDIVDGGDPFAGFLVRERKTRWAAEELGDVPHQQRLLDLGSTRHDIRRKIQFQYAVHACLQSQ